MCPVCITTAAVAWIAAGTTSTGGISALLVTRLRGKTNKTEGNQGERNGQE